MSSLKKKQELITGVRDLPPASFMLKIEKFSGLPDILNAQKKKYYESCCFEAGGYNWRFRLQVHRANKTNKKKIISIYLVLDEESNDIMATGSEIIANFKFFVYDQIRDNYLTVEDGQNVYKRFNKRENCHGISNVISVTTLKCASNGYLLNDTCVFGVELQVMKKITRTTECLSCIEIPPENRIVHTWKITNFSQRNPELCDPNKFTVEGRKWRIQIKTNYMKDWLYMNLKVEDTNYTSLEGLIRWLRRENNQALCPLYNIGVKNQLHKDRDVKHTYGRFFNPAPAVKTWSQIIKLEEIYDETKGFLVDDVLIVEASIETIFASKDIITDGI